MSTKVFVGNLVFSTTDDQLKTAFAAAANVVSANIITRGRRSLGYGFVEFASEEDAKKAVEAMNKKEVEGRAINVELARPRDAAKEEEARQKKAQRAAKPRQPRKPAASTTAAVEANGEASAPATKAPGARRRNARRARPAAAAAATTGAGTPAAAAPTGTGRRSAPRRARAPKPAQENRALSETTLFVANVPFSTDDEQLKTFFAEHNPKAAHVVRMRNGRSRGYGFVEFDTVEGQKAALAIDGKEVPSQNGTTLKLSVKVAMASRPEAAPAATETPAN